MRAIDNTRSGKRGLLYDGHRRKAGVSKSNDTRHWRHLRRLMKRWLIERMETW